MGVERKLLAEAEQAIFVAAEKSGKIGKIALAFWLALITKEEIGLEIGEIGLSVDRVVTRLVAARFVAPLVGERKCPSLVN